MVKLLWEQINEQRVSQEVVAARAGVSSSAMRKWRDGQRNPMLNDLEACLNVLGYEIFVRERTDAY